MLMQCIEFKIMDVCTQEDRQDPLLDLIDKLRYTVSAAQSIERLIYCKQQSGELASSEGAHPVRRASKSAFIVSAMCFALAPINIAF